MVGGVIAIEGLIWLNMLISELIQIRFLGGASIAAVESSEVSVSVRDVLSLNFSCKYFSCSSDIIHVYIQFLCEQ